MSMDTNQLSQVKNEAVQMVVSVSKTYPTLKQDLQSIAFTQGRSLSNLVTLVLAKFVEQNKTE
tara:strand:- start:4491 stop:4679 length:189 start_codon:yes stop_codon:yes gene_type:complete